jgi:hypothetical protein
MTNRGSIKWTRVPLCALGSVTVLSVVGCGTAGTQTRTYRLHPPANGVYIVTRWPAGDQPPRIPSTQATVTAHAHGTPLCSITLPSTDRFMEVRSTARDHKVGETLCAFFKHKHSGVFRTLP